MPYFDFAATTQMSENALSSYVQTAKEYWANTNSPHASGAKAQGLLTHCRQTLAGLLHIPHQSIIFTKGGSQSNDLAIRMSVQMLPANRREILISPLEHPSINESLATLANISLRTLPVNRLGQITPEILAGEITPQTGLIIVQALNSITGIKQDIENLAALAKQKKILFHCDGVQAFTKYDLPTNVSSYSASSHKIYGPKGCGLLYLNPEIGFNSIYPGARHEFGFLPGTIDLPAIAAFTSAAQDAYANRADTFRHYQTLRDLLLANLPDWSTIAAPGTFPGIVGLISPAIPANTYIDRLSEAGFYFSSTSACSDRSLTEPALLVAGLSEQQAGRYIRISFGRQTTPGEVSDLAKNLLKVSF